MKSIIIFVLLFFVTFLHAAPISTGRVEVVTVKTAAPNNKETKVPFRIPARYDASRPEMWRVLVLFGGRNTDGVKEANGSLDFSQWADREGIFLVCPGFKDDNYWLPETWSGKALLDALAAIRQKYNICASKLLFYGYSAGSQCSNLFPAWRPDIARAWVSHGCGVFHAPHPKMRDVPGLVTCGDADVGRFIAGREFVLNYRSQSVDMIWKTFPNLGHAVPPESTILARAFLGHYHNLHSEDLAPNAPAFPPSRAPMPVPAARATRTAAEPEQSASHPFVGDDMDGVFYPADDERVKRIQPEDRVNLPSEAIARAWGEPASI